MVLSEERHVVGMLTDRDVVVRAAADGLDVNVVTAAEVMTRNVETVADTTPIEDAVGLMRSARLRRLVIVDEKEEVTGVVSLDDVLAFLAEEFSAIGRLVSEQTSQT